MKIHAVGVNNRKRMFEVTTRRGRYNFPFAKAEPEPSRMDPVASVAPDRELACEAFYFVLASGREGSIHIEQVLDYNRDPGYLRDMLLYRLTVEAQERMAASPLSKREIIRRLSTSPAQFYRLLDPTNYNKTIDKLLALLHVLDCEVDLIVKS